MTSPLSLMAATYEGLAGADVTLTTRLDKGIEQDALLLQVIDGPELWSKCRRK